MKPAKTRGDAMRTARLAAAAFLGLCAAALAQSEGVAQFRGTMNAGPGKTIPSSFLVYYTKGVAYRTEWTVDTSSLAGKSKHPSRAVTGNPHKTIMIMKLSDPDHLLTLNDERKVYSITDLKKLRESLPAGAQETYTVQKLGRDSVAGHPCEKALMTSSRGTQSELCVSTELIPSAAWIATQRDRSNTMMKALRDAGLDGFPIRWVIRGKGEQQPRYTMELVRFEKKSVSPALFEVPAGYKQIDDAYLTLSPEQEEKAKKRRGDR